MGGPYGPPIRLFYAFPQHTNSREKTMFGFGMPQLVVILVIVMVVFGASRLPEIGGAIGKSLRNFKKASEGNEIEVKSEES